MTNEQIVSDLLTPVWAGISADYKRKYSYSIWQQFEDNIRAAAYTSRLSLFLSKVTTRLGVELADQHLERVKAVVASGEDRAILKALREDTSLLVVMTRLANDERKEKAKKDKEQKHASRNRSGAGAAEAAAVKDNDLPVRGDGDSSLFDLA